MVDKGWRKRLHDKKPKTSAHSKATVEDAPQQEHLTEKPAERVRSQPTEKLGWRRIYHGSRPETPVAPSTIASLGDDTEDSHSEVSSEAPSGRGRATPKAPKLSHYLSGYRNLPGAEEAQEFSFSTPWGLFPPPIEPPIDPAVAVQRIRSHIGHRSWVPLPVEYNNGILCIFEDYRKVSEEKESLATVAKDTLKAWGTAQEQWNKTEDLYKKEIRRLEVLIAQGKTGLSGLMMARQGSVVDRKRLHRQTMCTDRSENTEKALTKDQLDEQIKFMSQRGSVTFSWPSRVTDNEYSVIATSNFAVRNDGHSLTETHDPRSSCRAPCRHSSTWRPKRRSLAESEKRIGSNEDGSH
jgi:hypothetical protein